ncbi:PREDICTED: period circadian protein-like [Ceratosolen solmsi marchali]|uniref:Period circadian protein n=1 Tax=Ceratosolen solmsi marchali TaxID=326594 RepID=A0AAJ6VN37_9HYME|nr:PREDICTED: period circadian protein-like [Ceratosolen solmsi marchali]
MEETSTENAKISDSGYSNTGSNSQSHTSSETLPKPITKRKDKGYKKKKFKGAPTSFSITPALNHDTLSPEPCKTLLDRSIEEEATVVELVDATDSGVHNNNLITSAEGAGLTSKIRPIDDITSHSTVKLVYTVVQDEFYAVISMDDGLVLHASASLYTSLGYPIDWWTGKLFIDFLNPRDKYIFTDRIASEIAISRDFHPSGANGRKASIFCRLRRFNICVSTNDQYVPYRINLVVQNFHDDKMTVSQSHVMLLVASFQSVQSAYKDYLLFV